MKIVIVTGMSGSGKTVALKMFEDFGYYCVDNLPVELLLNFVDLTIESERGMKGIALGIDIRSGLDGLDKVIDELRHKKINMEIIKEEYKKSINHSDYKHFLIGNFPDILKGE